MGVLKRFPGSVGRRAWRASGLASAGFIALLLTSPSSALGTWTFADITDTAGVALVHDSGVAPDKDDPISHSGGVAIGDYDADGWPDVFMVGGARSGNRLFRNLRDGTFADVTAAARVDLSGVHASGSTFADIDGDGWLDIFLTTVGVEGESAPFRLYENRGNGRFHDLSEATGMSFDRASPLAPAFADIDLDGDLDIFVSHWGSFGILPPANLLWRNDGDFKFTDITASAGFDYGENPALLGLDWSLTPNFADVDGDGIPEPPAHG